MNKIKTISNVIISISDKNELDKTNELLNLIDKNNENSENIIHINECIEFATKYLETENIDSKNIKLKSSNVSNAVKYVLGNALKDKKIKDNFSITELEDKIIYKNKNFKIEFGNEIINFKGKNIIPQKLQDKYGVKCKKLISSKGLEYNLDNLDFDKDNLTISTSDSNLFDVIFTYINFIDNSSKKKIDKIKKGLKAINFASMMISGGVGLAEGMGIYDVNNYLVLVPSLLNSVGLNSAFNESYDRNIFELELSKKPYQITTLIVSGALITGLCAASYGIGYVLGNAFNK